MAIFRKVHVSFWKDEYVEGLNRDAKFLFLYLLTNDRATQCGIYEITLKQVCFDTGFMIPELLGLLEQFEKDKKIIYNAETKEIALKNWAKYNDSTSPKVKKCIEKELKNVKDRVLIDYLYSIDTVSNQVSTSIDTQSQEEEDKDKDLYSKPKEKKWNIMPTSDIELELPEKHIKSAIEQIKITRNIMLTEDKVKGMFKAFKIQCLTGTKWYQDEAAVFSHFLNWLKQQNFRTENYKQPVSEELSTQEKQIKLQQQLSKYDR